MQNTSLFTLTGSEGQIQRAEAIRAQTLQALVDHLARALGLTPLSRQSAASFLEEAARQWCNRQPARATWWIDQQHQLIWHLQADLERDAERLAAEYRAMLLASIRTEAAALHRVVRPDLEGLSLEALTYEEAVVVRLAAIHAQGQRLQAR